MVPDKDRRMGESLEHPSLGRVSMPRYYPLLDTDAWTFISYIVATLSWDSNQFTSLTTDLLSMSGTPFLPTSAGPSAPPQTSDTSTAMQGSRGMASILAMM